MRKAVLVAAAVVVAVLAVVLLLTRGGDTEAAGTESPQAAAAQRAQDARAAIQPQPERPADVTVQGSAEEGSTPRLSEPPRAGDGLLEVEVVTDAAQGGKPIAGAAVRLYWRGPIDPREGAPAWRLASDGRTDAEGRVALPSRPGAYLVSAKADGYAPVRRDVVRPFGEARTPVRLSLSAGHTLLGTTVVKGSNEPLAMVELSLTQHGRPLEGMMWGPPAAPPEERVWGSSDARGTFRLEGLAPGTYKLEASAPGHARTVLPAVRIPATAPLTVSLDHSGFLEGFVVDAEGRPAAGAQVRVGGRTPQVVTASEAGGFSVEVEAGPHPVQAQRGEEAGALESPVVVPAGKTVRDVRVQLGKGALLEGVVRARTGGQPVAGASVEVTPFQSRGEVARTLTDEAGGFRVTGLSPGSYDVTVSAAGFTRTTRRGLTVSQGERFPVEVLLVGTGAVAGTVRDAEGQPVVGALVRGGNRWGGMLGSTPAEGRTDGSGAFRLEGLEAGRVFITARREEDSLGGGQQVEVREGEVAQADITLAATGTVEGVVRAERGSLPAEGLVVSAFPHRMNRIGPADTARAEVDLQRGTFRMVLPVGTYGLNMVPLQMRGPRVSFNRGTSVTVEAGRTHPVELVYTAEDEGTSVVHARALEPDGTPSPGALVILRNDGGENRFSMAMSADEEGSVTFTVATPASGAGTFVVLARNGGRSGTATDVKPGAQVAVRMQPGASLHGRVVRADGAAVQGFQVHASSPEERMLAPTLREFAGSTFSLSDVPVGRVMLVVRTPDGMRGEKELTLSSGQRQEVEVVLRGSAKLAGRLVDAAGAPLADGFVMLQGGEAMRMGDETGPDGRFLLEDLPPGEHQVRLMRGRATATRTVQLAEGQTTDLGDVALTEAPPAPQKTAREAP